MRIRLDIRTLILKSNLSIYIIMETYVYRATIESIYDGDTITCTVDCGFGCNRSVDVFSAALVRRLRTTQISGFCLLNYFFGNKSCWALGPSHIRWIKK